MLSLHACSLAHDAKPFHNLQISQVFILACNRKSAPVHVAGSADNFSSIILIDRVQSWVHE
jgi:hypothetical protein